MLIPRRALHFFCKLVGGSANRELLPLRHQFGCSQNVSRYTRQNNIITPAMTVSACFLVGEDFLRFLQFATRGLRRGSVHFRTIRKVATAIPFIVPWFRTLEWPAR